MDIAAPASPTAVGPSRLSILATSNGEVEGPRRSANQAPRAHTQPSRPRRETTDVSRTPRTIVRRPITRGGE
jgi:hypothetical protein